MIKLFKTRAMTFSILATICSILVVLFTLLSTNQKDLDSKKSQDDLQKSVDKVSESLKKSLDKTTKIIDEIDSLGNGLSGVKDSLKNSLNEARKFQNLVDEQLRIAKLKFESEAANIVANSEKNIFVESPTDSSKYHFQITFQNVGNRNGIIKKIKRAFLVVDEDLNVKETLFNYIEESNDLINGNRGVYFIKNSNPFEKEYLKTTKDNFVHIVQFIYEDEITKKSVEKTEYFRWFGFNANGYTFNNLKDINIRKFKDLLD
ncbi:hypothetical protein [uncultured Algibacter sp.]|uniref:hypothetical protein n=1 Tax=uncultured Algibacter sp. TaxID=298659 RepID=UPI002632A3FF|nr:hypothetical protein [uncultured Algibacter sp.]